MVFISATTRRRSVVDMLALSAGIGLGNSELLQALVVILGSFAVSGVSTYVVLAHRHRNRPDSALNPTPDHLDAVLIERARSMGIRLPVERGAGKPVRVRFSDGSELFYFERDLDRYDRHVLGGLTPLDCCTVEDPPQMISEWTRHDKLRWLVEHPQKLDESDAL